MLLAGVKIPLGKVHLFVRFVDLLVDIAPLGTPGNTAGDGDMAFLHGPERILDTGMEGFAAGFAVDCATPDSIGYEGNRDITGLMGIFRWQLA